MNEQAKATEAATHTPGPWRWEFNPDQKRLKLCGGVPRFDLTLLDFVRSGMSGATARFRDPAFPNMNVMELASKWSVAEPGREHHADWFRLIDHPDARLIAAAPELLASCQEMHALLSAEFAQACRNGYFPDVAPILARAEAALAKAACARPPASE